MTDRLDPDTLPSMDVRPRQARFFEALDRHDADAMIVTSPSNIRWLTGFAGSNGTVVAHQDALTLITDSRYQDRAPVELDRVHSDAEIAINRKAGQEVTRLLGSAERVALEADHISWAHYREIDEDWTPGQELVATTELIAGLRAVKDDAEVARIEAAAAIVDRALLEVRAFLATGLSEREFARNLDAAIRSGGANELAFDTIVASGPNGAIPHHSPGDRAIESGDLVIVDVGAMIDGYRSDMTRTFCVGPMTADQQRHYSTVIDAQQAGVDAMVLRAETGDVDAAARAVIEAAGWGESFTHGTGHGVGLDIHELPRVAKDAVETYGLGTVATVEPGVYLRGVGGVRIEDTCVVTADGARRLTGFPKDLAEV